MRRASIDPHGYDAGKKINGKKRHNLVDTLGLLLHAIVHPADIQDRDGGVLVLSTLFGMYPFLQKLFADGGYQGPVFQKALAKARPHVKIESSNARIRQKGSRSCRSGRSSSVHLPGSIVAADWPRTLKTSPAMPWPSCVSPQSGSCSESSVINNQLSGPTLRQSKRAPR